jgi:hypothetical protein
MSVSIYIGMALSSETELQQAFRMLSDKHSRNAEIRDACERFSQLCEAHIGGLRKQSEHHGSSGTVDPERIRAALFHGARFGGLGLLRDLHDLSILVQQVELSYVALKQAAEALRDQDMLDAIKTFSSETLEQSKWIENEIKNHAAQALTVPVPHSDTLTATIPERPTPPSQPEAIWAPLAGATLMLVVGLLGWAVGRPWLFPALGPSAYLQAEMPAHPSARWYNTVVGHLVGLLAGFAAVVMVNAHGPAVLTTHVLTLDRVLASVLAVGLTILVCLLLKASHPPAGATTLLVALGTFKTLEDGLNVMAGVVIIAVIGELIRKIRLQGSVTKTTLKPADAAFNPDHVGAPGGRASVP